jgi:hypothetical protein
VPRALSEAAGRKSVRSSPTRLGEPSAPADKNFVHPNVASAESSKPTNSQTLSRPAAKIRLVEVTLFSERDPDESSLKSERSASTQIRTASEDLRFQTSRTLFDVAQFTGWRAS